MRVVVDTNVLISAALKENTPPEAAVHRAAGSHVLLKSTLTERELFVTLDRARLAPLIRPRFRDWLRLRQRRSARPQPLPGQINPLAVTLAKAGTQSLSLA